MYIDERLLKILETHKGETVDVNFMISLIKTIAEEYETEQLQLYNVVMQNDTLCCNEDDEIMDENGSVICRVCKKVICI